MATKQQNSDPMSLENLFKAAFNRTKDRFLSYFLAFLFNMLIGGVAIVAALLVGAILVVPFAMSKNFMMAGIWGGIVGVAFIIAMIYISSWMTLLFTQIMIQEEKKGVIETFKSLKPRVGGFIIFSLLSGLFMIGLLPLGLISLFIIPILWGVWNSFSAFVYLEENKKGLENLWVSRAIFNTSFWGNFFKLVLVSLALMIISMGLSFSSRDNSLGGLLYFLISIVSVPFMISYKYEMYKNAKEQVKGAVTKPKIWIVLSIIGYILIGVLGAAAISVASSQKTFPSYPKMPSYSNYKM